MQLSIVIVNYNGGEMIRACIESIFQETKNIQFEIIVVDNHSTDGSMAKLKEAFPSVRYIENADNLGFAAANNIGFSAAKGEYILLLNPDVEVTDAAIDKAMNYMLLNPDVGAMGCRALWSDGEQQSTLIRFPTLCNIVINIFIPYKLMQNSSIFGQSRYVGLDYDQEHDVEVVAGCFMLLPRSVLDEVGGLDDDFFMFGEEVEWCWRIYHSGRKVRYYPDCTIIHRGGGCSSSLSYRKVLLIAKGQLMVFQKTRGKFIAFLANILMLMRDAPRALIWLIMRFISRPRAEKAGSLKSSYIRFCFLLNYLVGIEKEI